MTRARASIAAAIALAMLSSSVPAGAGKADCAPAYVEAQKAMRSGALKKARDKLIVCGGEECLPAVKKDCVTWLGEVNASIPSVVVAARGIDGAETFDVRVFADEEQVAHKLDSKGIELDPGTHKLRFEIDGASPITKEVVLRTGQKNKLVEVSFAPEQAPKGPSTTPEPTPVQKGPSSATSDVPRSKDKSGGGPPLVSLVLGGVGIVAAGVGGVFWIAGESKKSDLESSKCAPACRADDVDTVKRDRLFGDVLVGVGLVAIGAGVVLWLVNGKGEVSTRAGSSGTQIRF